MLRLPESALTIIRICFVVQLDLRIRQPALYTARMQNKAKTPAALIVLDGWGLADDTLHNAIAAADTPVFDRLWREYPHARFGASGTSVGLPKGQMGNSEIGHMSIGAGAPIDTDLVRINKAIEAGSFGSNDAFRNLFAHTKEHGSTLHVFGLVSPGGIHSHQDHLHALVRAAVSAGVPHVLVHAFLDGRDTPPTSGAKYLAELEMTLKEWDNVRIASISGRYFAMDRDTNWERTDRTMAAIFDGMSENAIHGSPSEALAALYATGALDEHIEPTVCLDDTGNAHTVADRDALLCFNFRADRARQLAARTATHLTAPKRTFVTMTEYDPTIPATVAFPPFRPTVTLAGVISAMGLTQVHVAETEKYAHATYFLNGGREAPHQGEEHVLIESRKDIRTHDEAPEMRAKEIADAAIAQIENGTDFLFVNIANADMVGHTANVPALMRALKAADTALGRIVEAIETRGGIVLVTADHGNAEQNHDPTTDGPHTAHTTNLVPAILTDTAYTLSDGALPDVAPTLLSVMGLPVPPQMTGTPRATKREP